MSIRRRATALSLLTVLLALPVAVAAHAELVASDPADGAVLAEPPGAVELRFGGELDPDGSAFTVTGPSGDFVGSGEVDLDVAERNVLRGIVDARGDGAYEVRWTAVSIDGHSDEGSLGFTVRPGTAPNTALPRPDPTLPLGVLLLVVAVAIALLRRRATVLLILAIGLVACVTDTRPEACDAESVTIDLTLSATELTPDDPAVCRDQEVTLDVASEVDGVLHIHGYDAAVPATQVHAGDTITLDFTASRSGQFPIELHPSDDPEGIAVGIFTVHEP